MSDIQHVYYLPEKTLCGKSNDIKRDEVTPVCPECFIVTIGDFHYVYSILKQMYTAQDGIINLYKSHIQKHSDLGDVLRQIIAVGDAVALCMDAKENRKSELDPHPAVPAITDLALMMHARALAEVVED